MTVLMNSTTPFASLEHSCKATLRWARARLSRKGLRALQTFDLEDARPGTADCQCPQHGTAECDCQMVVLLVYGQAEWPATLIVHGSGMHSWLSLVNSPGQCADASLRAAIQQALQVN